MKKRQRMTRKELEARTARTMQECAIQQVEAVAAFQRRTREAMAQAVEAGNAALDDGKSLEYAKAMFSFAREVGFIEAVFLLPPSSLFGPLEFHKLPIVDDPTEAPEGWSRFEIAGMWIIQFRIQRGCLIFRAEVQDFSLNSN